MGTGTTMDTRGDMWMTPELEKPCDDIRVNVERQYEVYIRSREESNRDLSVDHPEDILAYTDGSKGYGRRQKFLEELTEELITPLKRSFAGIHRLSAGHCKITFSWFQ
ncbi:unnamed protein product [Allacma fusca]|uniref:Uncharacterized protein n=1 Tax=Allacma fusca TaxID=39272 RepID=A0A8J2IYJ5_9HEXA|nr:unnamed protein product [Allacma fusca]